MIQKKSEFMKINRLPIKCCALILSFFSLATFAADLEITVFSGQMYSSDLIDETGINNIPIDSGYNLGFAVAWQDSPNGQGQIMLNAVSHNFTGNNNTDQSLDIIYAHFNGIAQFRQKNYVTTVSLGLGGAYFDSKLNEELYPSATLAFGTRYEFASNIALVTELRGYASLVNEKDNMFCEGSLCQAQFKDALWIESNISIGIAVKF